LSPAEGRKFALTVGAAFVALAGFTWWRGHENVATVAGALGAAFIVAGLLAPGQLGLIYRGWMAFGLALSKITTPIFMGVVYFLVITPIGIFRRSIGRNALIARGTTTVWAARDLTATSDLNRQF
jgi:Saxitoxin biosynthesis operon protein SxtJ